MLALPEWYQPRERDFPRFQDHAPTCLKHPDQPMKMETTVEPVFGDPDRPYVKRCQRQTRTVYRCSQCPFVAIEAGGANGTDME